MSDGVILPLLIIVPARAGEDAAPLLLEALGDGPILDHTLAFAERQTERGDVSLLVTTDNDAIAAAVSARGKGWLVRRRSEAEVKGRYFHALAVAHDWAREQTGKNFAAILILEPTHPFRPTGLISMAADLMRQQPGLDTVVSVVREYGSFWIRDSHSALERISNPEGKEVYREVAGLTLLTRPHCLASGDPMGHDVGFIVVDEQWALVDIHGATGVEFARRFAPMLAL